jgi:hypothetical protein
MHQSIENASNLVLSTSRGSPVGSNNLLLIKEEAFCQRKWKAISASADETWEARLYDKTSLIENVPPELLPHHYLLSKAYG